MVNSITLNKYKETLMDVVQMYYPISREELSPIVDYSISKRYKEYPNYSNITKILNPVTNVYNKYYDNNNNYYQINSSNVLESLTGNNL